MKRLLPAFIIALAAHVLILGMPFERLSLGPLETDLKRPLSMTFTYRQPARTAEPKRPPQSEVKPPAKASAPPPKKVKPQEQPVNKPATQAKPVPPPPVQPQPAPPEPGPKPERESQPPSLQTAVPLTMQQVAPVVDPAATGASQSKTKTAVGPPLRKARPLYRQNPPPRYPRSARRRGYEGRVVLEVKVLKNGAVGDLRVVTSSGYSVLDKAAVKSVRNWLFEPGVRGDQKVDMWVRVPIRFRIESSQ